MNEVKTFVAYFDILGFSKFLEKNNPDKVVTAINNFSLSASISIAYAGTERINTDLELIDKKDPFKMVLLPDGNKIASPNLENATINSVLIFDSVVFWTNDNKKNDFNDLLYNCINFMRFMFNIGFPIRGAIAYGSFYFSGHTIQSKSTMQHFSLVSHAQLLAMELEKKQIWTGCVLHESVIVRCEEISISLSSLEATRKVIKYPVPFRNNEQKENREMYALIWLVQQEQYFPKHEILDITSVIREAFSSYDKEIGINEEEKITNTAKFVNFVCPLLQPSTSKCR